METKKACKKCKLLKARSEFHKHAKKADGLQNICKPCQNDCAKSWQRRNPERAREIVRNWQKNNPERMCYLAKKSKIKIKYGLSVEEYEALLAKGCAICGQKLKKMCADHCHVTGKLREALCSPCNTGLGMFKDDLVRLKKAIAYLKRHQ